MRPLDCCLLLWASKAKTFSSYVIIILLIYESYTPKMLTARETRGLFLYLYLSICLSLFLSISFRCVNLICDDGVNDKRDSLSLLGSPGDFVALLLQLFTYYFFLFSRMYTRILSFESASREGECSVFLSFPYYYTFPKLNGCVAN